MKPAMTHLDLQSKEARRGVTAKPRATIILPMLFAAALMVCGSARAQVGGVPLDGFPGVGEPPRVVLLDPGEGEKSELRFRFSAGSIHEMVMTIRMSNPQAPEIHLPGIRYPMVTEVLEANEDRARVHVSIPTDPDLVDAEDAPPELVANLMRGLQSMSSFRAQITITSLGVTEEMEFQFDTGNPGLEQFHESIRQSLSQLTRPFPIEPVGVGARWQTLKRIASPVTVYQLETFELLRHAGSSVTLGMKVEQLIPMQSIASPEAPPGATVDVAGSGEGSGEVIQDMHSPVLQSHSSLNSVTTTTVHVGDEVYETITNVAIVVDIEPRG